jgi:hypothetical protein
MNAIRVLRHIDSDHVHIPELREMLGRDVEITIVPRVIEDPSVETVETFLGSALHRPAPSAEELAELRAMGETDPAVAAALRMAARGGLDVETILATRNAE